MMKIGFSSIACPEWDLETIVTKASEFGFDGIELHGLQGELNLPLVAELASDPAQTRRLFSDREVELVCLGCSATLDTRNRAKLAACKGTIAEYVELAAGLNCPYVRIHAGEVQRLDNAQVARARIAEAIRSLAPIASRHGVTLLVENGGGFPGSTDVWFMVDAAESPAVRCCWNQCHAMGNVEEPTVSVPRLVRRIGMVHVCDAEFDDRGLLTAYRLPGDGQVGIARQIELLKGLGYSGYLMFACPRLSNGLCSAELAEPERVLPLVAAYLRGQLDEKQATLTAYKGDKHPVRFASPPATVRVGA